MTAYIYLTKVGVDRFTCKIECNYRLFNEMFSDPFDVFDSLDGESNPGGDPYRIKCSWINVIRGTIIVGITGEASWLFL